MQNLLINAIENAGASFEEDELAFLALTSKIERPFLDRFAFAVHKALSSSGALVAREFPVPGAGRADVAILQSNQVSCIVEGKAMAVADCTRPEPRRREYADLLQQDLSRYATSPIPKAQIYSLLLGVYPLRPIPTELRPVIKYVSLLNGAYTRLQTADRICEEANSALRGYLREDAAVGAGKFVGGVALDVPVEVHWWCFGPFQGPQNLRLLRENAAEHKGVRATHI